MAFHGEFADWVEKHKVKGHYADGKESFFVPPEELRAYWTPDRISIALQATLAPIKEIQNRFLGIFSTLVHISRGNDYNKVGYICRFIRGDTGDVHLPFADSSKPPAAFPVSKAGEEDFADFFETQWLFHPVTLGGRQMMRRELHSRAILPIQSIGNTPRNSGCAKVKVAKLYPSSKLPGDKIIMKEYPLSAKVSWENEVEAYIAHENQGVGGKYFLDYYGSFIQNGRCILLLEYADHGSLLEFFERNNPPITASEYYSYWERLSRLLAGIQTIHSNNTRVTSVLTGTHQDLKLANIFVFSDSDPNAPYPYRYKIGDFDLSHFRKSTPGEKSSMGPDRGSTRMYGAPELCKHDGALEPLDAGAGWEVDIWSLGCVFVEAAIWSIGGERGREEFRRRREEATNQIPYLHEAGYGACFHNGEKRLPAVDNVYWDFLNRRRVFDTITEQVVKEVFDSMLIGEEYGRQKASNLLRRFNDILRNNEHLTLQVTLISPGTEASPLRYTRSCSTPRERRVHGSYLLPLHNDTSLASEGSSAEHAASRGLFDNYSVGDILSRDGSDELGGLPHLSSSPRHLTEFSSNPTDTLRVPGAPKIHTNSWKGKSPERTRFSAEHNPTRSTSPSVAARIEDQSHYPSVLVSEVLKWKSRRKSVQTSKDEQLPGMDKTMCQLQGRRQYFLIDDSNSMKPHWEDVTTTFEAIAYIVKGTHAKGVDVRLASNPTRNQKSPRTTALLPLVRNAKPTSTCNMENSLNTIFSDILNDVASAGRHDHGFLATSSRPHKQPTGATIYVFTDGLFATKPTHTSCPSPLDSPSFRAVSEAIKSFSEKIHARIYTSIQFIRFGEDEWGKVCLKYLDDKIGESTPSGWDIVDTRHHKGSVWSMVIGSIDQYEDQIADKGDDGHPSSSSGVVASPSMVDDQ